MDLKPPLILLLASPRGFCAGVDRAIAIVDRALQKYGAPVYVRHEIVHNRHVVADLREKGAVFVDDLAAVPSDRPVIFSAHGVAKMVVEQATQQNLFILDATCPLVAKVHNEVIRWHSNGYHIIFIGHRGHPEVEGTMGQLPNGAITLVETVDDVKKLQFSADVNLAFATQTTLSVDETAMIVRALQEKYHNLQGPKKEDICYATTNRQGAVKQLAPLCDIFLVVGSENSSNSRQLVQVALDYGAKSAFLLDDVNQISNLSISSGNTIGLSAGASAPESLVQEIIEWLRCNFDVTLIDKSMINEDIVFRLPSVLE